MLRARCRQRFLWMCSMAGSGVPVMMGINDNREEIRDQYGREMYLCAGACGWSDVKAYYGRCSWGVDPRFLASPVWKEHGGVKKRHLLLLNITIFNVQLSDAGVYYCAWAIKGRDSYQEVRIDVIPLEAEMEIIKKVFMKMRPDPVTEIPPAASINDVEFIMGSGFSDDIKEVRIAKMKCEGNYACALALLQREVLRSEVDGECWICMQLQTAWRTFPVTPETVCHKKDKCEIPRQMSKIIQMMDNLKADRTITFDIQDHSCSHTGLPFKGPAFHVQSYPVDLCICSNDGKHNVGISECRNTVTLNHTDITHNCTIKFFNQTTSNFVCSFSHIDSAPGMVWTCGGMAYYHLDQGDWRGCCYPALLTTGTTVLTKKDIEGKDVELEQGRKRRDTSGMPNRYNGYKTVNPWTKTWENVGWSLVGMFTGLGTTTALNKINGLTWQILSLENDTAVVSDLLTEELKKTREAVIQNRLVLDLLTSQWGGVCKMLGVPCCFHIPDNSNNVMNIVEHMKESIPEPEKVDPSWFSWLNTLWGGWGTWIFHTVIPIGVLSLYYTWC